MAKHIITLAETSRSTLTRALRENKIQILDHGQRWTAEGGYTVDAVVGDEELRGLEAAGCKILKRFDLGVTDKDRWGDVGQGNRFEGAPTGLRARAPSATYLNVDEVESALSVAANAPFSQFVQLITLPHPTWEGRTCHAVRIGTSEQENRPGLCLIGGVHANEWGSSDILINFIDLLENAYADNTGIDIGPRTFTPSDIRTIVDTLEILVFPQVNPDGRHYCMKHEPQDPQFRKNRRTQAPNSEAEPGVDINRNFDFLWNFPSHFSPEAFVDSSTTPNGRTYIGPAAFSEPESKNVKWILDNFHTIRFFVDLHSYGECILHSWGDDDHQSTEQEMNFLNAEFNDVRGLRSRRYKEFFAADDLRLSRKLAKCIQEAIQDVSGKVYTVQSSFRFSPSSGASDDYCYSRPIVGNNEHRIISHVIEWGEVEPCPSYNKMKKIIKEVTAGLLALSLRIATPSG